MQGEYRRLVTGAGRVTAGIGESQVKGQYVRCSQHCSHPHRLEKKSRLKCLHNFFTKISNCFLNILTLSLR